MASGSIAITSKLAPRPVDENWSCRRSGDCCRQRESLLVTESEAGVLRAAAEKVLPISKLNNLRFIPQGGDLFQVPAAPCPLLNGNFCVVYESRPFVCRMFVCMRPEPAKEPLQLAPLAPVLRYGMVGCVNARERILESRAARRLFDLLFRKAQRWARNHGWTS